MRGVEPYEQSRRNARRSSTRTEQASAVAPASVPTQRVYLTDPPTDYRQPSDSAAYGDLGEPEKTKERRRERVGQEKTGLRRLVPWL